MRFSIYSLFLLIFLSITSACSDDNGNSNNSFDRKSMLVAYADELIIPAFSNLLSSTEALKTKAEAFLATPNNSSLNELNLAWAEVAEKFQYCNFYDFGPAETSIGKFSTDIGTFPASPNKIENLISQMSIPGFNPLNNFDRDARGIYGIEYLLFSKNTSQTLSDFSLGLNSNRGAYLNSIVNDLLQQVQNVTTGWQSYRSTFINADGIDAGSSASLLFNEFVLGFEIIKNFKLGLPLGLRAGQSQMEPDKVEAFYSGISYRLIQKNFENVVKVYRNTNGIGFDDYLKTVSGGEDLVLETEAQIALINDLLLALPSASFSDQITSNYTQQAIELHTEMLKLTRYIKSDMSSLLGISITFSSSDGD